MKRLATEILEMIFCELKGDFYQRLFSAAMVNKQWCRIIIPMMWKNPFETTNFPDKLVGTFLSILDEESRLLLINNEIDLSSSPSFQATFDYVSFIQVISIDKIYKGIKNYLFPNDEDKDKRGEIRFYLMIEEEKRIKRLKDKNIGLVFQQIYSLILKRSKYIKYICSRYLSSRVMEHEINSIPYVTNASDCLNNLTTVTILGENLAKLHLGLSEICKNLSYLTTSCFEQMESAYALATLIRSQNSLEHLGVFFSEEYLLCPVLESLSSQKNSLTSLTMNTCGFNKISDEALESFMSCKILKVLVLERCVGLKRKWFLPLSRSFPLLKTLIFYYKDYIYYFPEKFLVGLIETANMNLQKLCFNVYSNEIIKAILNHVPEFTECIRDLNNGSYISCVVMNQFYILYVILCNNKFG